MKFSFALFAMVTLAAHVTISIAALIENNNNHKRDYGTKIIL